MAAGARVQLRLLGDLERLLEGFQGEGFSSTVSRFKLSAPQCFIKPCSIHLFRAAGTSV